MSRFYLLLILCFVLGLPLHAEKSLQDPHTRVSLIGGETTAEGIAIGVEFQLEPEWHIYWKNPGDSGAAPKFDFQVTGGSISNVQWPIPERVRLGDLTNYGYNRRVVFPFVLKPDAGSKSVKVTLALEYLVCKVECIPGFSTLEATFHAKRPGEMKELADPRHPLPQTDSPFTLQVVSRTASGVKFRLNGEEELRTLREVDLFPIDGTLFATKAPVFREESGSFTAELPWETNAKKDTKQTRLLLKVSDGTKIRGFELPVELGVAGFSWSEVAQAILFAFLGGILLNLMPCVFPVLSIKVLSLVGESQSPGAARRGGWLYTFGVVASFLALAGLLLVLRASGEQLGWGFQLQSPLFVLAMAVLFFVVGLNFLGVFEIGYGAMRLGGSLQAHPLFNSSFGTGVLATFVATPCTAPFMGAALGVSLLLPWWAALAIFASLGIGMAVPFLLLSHFPAVLKRLPRPGPWMEKLKQFFAFPLFASTLWLGWVLILQSGDRGFLSLGLCLLGLGLAGWLARQWKGLALIVGIFSITWAVSLLSSEKKTVVWEPYSKTTIQQATGNGTPVFIDFTAAWCLTCQWNKKAVLDTAPVQEIFAKNSVKLIRADWTDRDPAVTEALASYGRNSVPLYVFVPPGGEAILLPELIKRSDIERLFPVGTALPKE